MYMCSFALVLTVYGIGVRVSVCVALVTLVGSSYTCAYPYGMGPVFEKS